MTDLSLNARQQGISTPELTAALGKLGSRYVLVQDDVGRADEMAAAGYTVVFRSFWPDPQRGDDDAHLHCTPAEFVAHMQGFGLHPDVYWHVINEPTTDFDLLAYWTVEVMALAKALGRRCVVLNLSTGTPDHLDWRDVLEPVLEALQDGWHVLGLHEYVCADYAVSVPWHIGRFQYALDACAALGYTQAQVWITETGMDLTGSWQSLGLSAEAFADEVRRCLEGVYRPAGIEVVFLFCAGPWQNGQGWEFNVLPAIDALAAVVGEGDPMIWADCILTVKSDGNLNVRAAANTNAAVVGTLKPGAYAGQCAGEVDGGDWRWLNWRGDGKEGYVALRNLKSGTVLSEVSDAPAPEPEPEPEPTPGPEPLPDVPWQAHLAVLYGAMSDLGEGLQDVFNDLETGQTNFHDRVNAVISHFVDVCQEQKTALELQAEALAEAERVKDEVPA